MHHEHHGKDAWSAGACTMFAAHLERMSSLPPPPGRWHKQQVGVLAWDLPCLLMAFTASTKVYASKPCGCCLRIEPQYGLVQHGHSSVSSRLKDQLPLDRGKGNVAYTALL
jgi:hypothetical protein